jgi:hypothetical protein
MRMAAPSNPYNTVSRDDFGAMIDVDRYGRRSRAFDQLIARTEEHFWDPDDRDYVRFDTPWAGDQPLMPLDFFVELNSAVADRLDERQQIAFANTSLCWSLSQILHGEQGALGLSTSLCDMFVDPGAQEYAANQAREEARHVRGFANYLGARFGGHVLPVGDTLGTLLRELVGSEVVYKKIVGMQMLVEGLAMGAFATLHAKSHDPLLRRVCQLTMTDEAFHHRFGKIWAQQAMPGLDEAEHAAVEDWALHCFTTLLFNLANANQKRALYPRFGLDPDWVDGAVREVFTDGERRRLMRESTNIFRVLVKTLLATGIITSRTRHAYAEWVDMEELAGEGDRMVGDDVVEAGIRSLRDINAGKRKIVHRIGA